MTNLINDHWAINFEPTNLN